MRAIHRRNHALLRCAHAHASCAQLWDLRSGEAVLALSGHTARVVSVAFHADGDMLATASFDATVRLWSVQDGACCRVLEGHSGWVVSVCWSPREAQTLLSASWDGTARLWDAQTGACARTLRHGDASVLAACYSPCGRYAATVTQDAPVKIWTIKTATCSSQLAQAGALCVAWSGEGAEDVQGALACGGESGGVRLFGKPPLYAWLEGLRLERFFEALEAHGCNMLTAVASLEFAELVALGLSHAEAARFAHHAQRMHSSASFQQPPPSPLRQLTAFLAPLLGGAETDALSLSQRLDLATLEELGGVTEQQLVAAGCHAVLAQEVLACALAQGWCDAHRAMRDDARRHQGEQLRRESLLRRCSVQGCHAALAELQRKGAPPTATAFFITHCRDEAEAAAEALGCDLVSISDDVIGHSIDEVWCGHQPFPTDVATEEAMLNGVRGCTAVLCFLTSSTLLRPYVLLELRCALAVKKPLVLVHEPDARWGGAELSDILDTAPDDLTQWLASAPVVPHRRLAAERLLMMGDVFKAVRVQGGVFHALLSISAHASLLCELSQMRSALARERELVLELGTSTLVSEIQLLKVELEQETACTAVERRRGDEAVETSRKLSAQALVWERQLQRSLEREQDARRCVGELTDSLERLGSGGDGELRHFSSAALERIGELAGSRARAAMLKLARMALGGLFQSCSGGAEAVGSDTLEAFLQHLELSQSEQAALLQRLEEGRVDADAWARLVDALLSE